MATADEVVTILTVQDAAYIQRLKADEAAFTTAMGKIEASSGRAGAALATIGTRGASNINAVAKSTSALTSQTGNLAAQFNDIGVQLAGGQSPFLIALQQGTQINQVLGQAGAGGAVKALAGAFASLINPVSLATIGIITLGGFAVQYFASLLGDGKDATEVLKEQEDLIRSVAERWGEAVPALQAYIDQLDRAAEGADLSEAYDVVVEQQFEALRAVLGDVRAEFAAARVDLQALGAGAQDIDALQSEFDSLRVKIEDGTATTEDLERMMALLANTTGASTVPSMVNLQAVLGGLIGTLRTAAEATAALRAEQNALANADAQVDAFNSNREFVAEQERINSLTAEQLALENEISRVKKEAERGKVPLSEQQALELAQSRLSAEERRAAIIKANRAETKGGASAASDAERERQAVLDLIEALEYEQSLIGVTAEQKAVMNALRKAGAAATDEERARIEELVLANIEYQSQLDASKKVMEDVQKIAGDVFSGFIKDIRNGVDGAEALSNAFDKLADQLIDMAVQGLVQAAFGGLFGGGGGGILGGLFGGLFGGKKGFASGTANTGGMRGEPRGVVHGQEAVIPLPSGGKVPVQLAGGASGGGMVEVRVTPSKYFDAQVETISGQVAAQVTSTGISSYDSALGQRMAEKQMREGR